MKSVQVIPCPSSFSTRSRMPSKSSQRSPSPKAGASQRKGAKGKGKSAKSAKGDMAVRATGYVAGDYMESHKASDPRYEWNDKGKRVEVCRRSFFLLCELKLKRSQRALPECLSQREKKVLKKVRHRARRLDYGLNFGGFRFGPSALIGEYTNVFRGGAEDLLRSRQRLYSRHRRLCGSFSGIILCRSEGATS